MCPVKRESVEELKAAETGSSTQVRPYAILDLEDRDPKRDWEAVEGERVR